VAFVSGSPALANMTSFLWAISRMAGEGAPAGMCWAFGVVVLRAQGHPLVGPGGETMSETDQRLISRRRRPAELPG